MPPSSPLLCLQLPWGYHFYYYYYLSFLKWQTSSLTSFMNLLIITRVIYSVLLLAVRKNGFSIKEKLVWILCDEDAFPSGRMAQNACFFIFHGSLCSSFCRPEAFVFVRFFWRGKPPRQTLLKYQNKIAKVNLGAAVLKKSLREFSHSPSLRQQRSGESHQRESSLICLKKKKQTFYPSYGENQNAT